MLSITSSPELDPPARWVLCFCMRDTMGYDGYDWYDWYDGYEVRRKGAVGPMEAC